MARVAMPFLFGLLASCGARSEVVAPATRDDAGRPLPDAAVEAGPEDASTARPDAAVQPPVDAGPPAGPGCADGTREAFVDGERYPDVAGCAGGWDAPGIYARREPTCGRTAGNDGANPDGTGCRIEDLCAIGWHVCVSADDLATHSADGCAGARQVDGFFVTRQSGPGCGECATGSSLGCGGNDCVSDCQPSPETTNDVFGCGGLGALAASSCAPLDRFGENECAALPAPWSCLDHGDGTREVLFLVKPGASSGGALCCRDD